MFATALCQAGKNRARRGRLARAFTTTGSLPFGCSRAARPSRRTLRGHEATRASERRKGATLSRRAARSQPEVRQTSIRQTSSRRAARWAASWGFSPIRNASRGIDAGAPPRATGGRSWRFGSAGCDSSTRSPSRRDSIATTEHRPHDECTRDRERERNSGRVKREVTCVCEMSHGRAAIWPSDPRRSSGYSHSRRS